MGRNVVGRGLVSHPLLGTAGTGPKSRHAAPAAGCGRLSVIVDIVGGRLIADTILHALSLHPSPVASRCPWSPGEGWGSRRERMKAHCLSVR
jgi:hypothetical protein